MDEQPDLQSKLASLHSMSVEIAALRDLPSIHDRALGYCLDLTGSRFAFTGLLGAGNDVMEVAAIKGFEPSPEFYESFHLMALRPSVVGVVVRDEHGYIANDVPSDPRSVGQPPGHPPVQRFLGVPLRVGDDVIGMIGVANNPLGYSHSDEELLSTFANQVAVAVDNARLYQRQRTMIAELHDLHDQLTEVEQQQLLGRERDRIAGELHDRIEQEVFTIGVRINALLERDGLPPFVADELREVRRVAAVTSDEVRRVVFSLAGQSRPIEDLTNDLRSRLEEFERASGITAHLAATGEWTPAVRRVKQLVHGIVDEALTNVRKHAQARTVLVSLRYDDDRLTVVVQDDGLGAPDVVLDAIPQSYLHFGLRHIHDMVRERGGLFTATNGEESGLVVSVELPLGPGLS